MHRHDGVFTETMVQLWSEYADVPKGIARDLGERQKPRRVKFAFKKECPTKHRRADYAVL
jgi:hypothetical protein